MSSNEDGYDRKSNTLARVMGATRYIMFAAVLAIMFGATILLIIGSVDMISGVWEQISSGNASEDNVRLILIESVDTILISTVLYVIAVGLYQLFIHPSLDLPDWLQTKDVSELEQRLSGMVVTILGVIFLTSAIDGSNGSDLLYLGLAIAAVIIGISIFLYQEKK